MIHFSEPKVMSIVGFPLTVTGIQKEGTVIGAIYHNPDAGVPRPYNLIINGKDRGFFATSEDAQRVAVNFF